MSSFKNGFQCIFLVNCHFTSPLLTINLFLLPSFFVLLLPSESEGRILQVCVLWHFYFFEVHTFLIIFLTHFAIF